MKYIKTYEHLFNIKEIDMKGMVYISKPEYPNSEIIENIIFVNKVLYGKGVNDYGYEIFGKQIKMKKNNTYLYDSFTDSISEEEYNKIDFKTMSEFYKENEEFVREHMLNIQDILNCGEYYSQPYKKFLKELLDSLTCPETEYILQINKYNL